MVILTFESRLDTNEDASLVARLTQALQQTVDDARTLPMRLGGVVKAQQVVVHPVAMQVILGLMFASTQLQYSRCTL